MPIYGSAIDGKERKTSSLLLLQSPELWLLNQLSSNFRIFNTISIHIHDAHKLPLDSAVVIENYPSETLTIPFGKQLCLPHQIINPIATLNSIIN